MTYLLISLYLATVTMFWFSISLLMDLILLIMSIMFGSCLISKMFMSSWASYLIVLAIVGGLMILYSFIVIMNPNLIEVIIIPKYFSYFVLVYTSLLMAFLVFISSETYTIEFYLTYVTDQYVLINYCSIYPYVVLYLFLIIILLMMLFIVDFIVVSNSSSMILF